MKEEKLCKIDFYLTTSKESKSLNVFRRKPKIYYQEEVEI